MLHMYFHAVNRDIFKDMGIVLRHEIIFKIVD